MVNNIVHSSVSTLHVHVGVATCILCVYIYTCIIMHMYIYLLFERLTKEFLTVYLRMS